MSKNRWVSAEVKLIPSAAQEALSRECRAGREGNWVRPRQTGQTGVRRIASTVQIVMWLTPFSPQRPRNNGIHLANLPPLDELTVRKLIVNVPIIFAGSWRANHQPKCAVTAWK